MGGVEPDNPPMTDGVCSAWAQQHELPSDVQQLHEPAGWCFILALASDVLWAASGRQWRGAQRTETTTLDLEEYACTDRWGYTRPLRWSPGDPKRVRLPRPDVTAITAVTVAGQPFTRYRRSGSWAVRTDGRGWPAGPGTTFTYTYGRVPPPSGRLAVVNLATELGKALAGQKCSLPARVTSVTRQGITYEAVESLEFLKEGLTGLYSVDLWIRSVNPRKTTQQGSVWSPDMVETRKV